jgi:hypothetical protein
MCSWVVHSAGPAAGGALRTTSQMRSLPRQKNSSGERERLNVGAVGG